MLKRVYKKPSASTKDVPSGLVMRISANPKLPWGALPEMRVVLNTLPCSAVGVGVGVDFGLFIFSRIREEMKETSGDWGQSVYTTARTATKGVVYTALSLILPCLAWYYMSSLKFQAQMGLLLSLLLAFNMISALVLHPALIYRLKPKFIYKPF